MLKPEDLVQFTGTENYYKHQFGGTYTDGVKYVAEEAGAYWLLDVIFSHQPEALKWPELQEFQLWQLKVAADKTAIVTCRTDTDAPIRIQQAIPFTDFPLPYFKFYLIDNVLILSTEY